VTFRRSAKDRTQLGCVGGALCFLLWGLSKCNDWALWLPGWQADRVRAAITIGADWPSALAAADRRLPAGNPMFAECRLARGEGSMVTGRLGSKYSIHLEKEVATYATSAEWETALRERVLKPQLCRSMVLSVNRDYEMEFELDARGMVTQLSRVTKR
jgi:hypothetical protein